MTAASRCRFCAELLPPAAATRCPQCGEALGSHPTAELRWDARGITIVAPGALPARACFGCARRVRTRNRLVFDQERTGHPVLVPLCVVCSGRAAVRPVALASAVAVLATAGLFARWGDTALDTLAALVVLGIGGVVATYLLARTRVRVRWCAGEATVLLPDPAALRRALDLDAS
ncbi:MAG: hypothetical protein KIT58_07420 [Planctomycetota bacterium]|nr:hypothetical protein [Planctomycetota bacterium]